MILLGIFVGFLVWFLVRYLVAGLYSVDQNQRAVKTIFGRAERLGALAVMFEILEAQNIAEGGSRITLVPRRSDLLNQLVETGVAPR